MIKRYLAGALTGLLLVLSTAPVGLWWLSFVAFLPLFFALDGSCSSGSGTRAVQHAFGIGFAAGFVYFAGCIYWVVNSMYFYGGLPLFVSIPIMLVLVAYLALYPALFSTLFAVLLQRLALCSISATGGCPVARTLFIPLFSIITVPVIWVTTEFLRATLFTGFPWTLLGYTQGANLHLIQVADITGVWWLSYIVVALNAALFMFARFKRSANGSDRRSALPEALGVCGAFALIALILLYGIFRIPQVDSAVAGWKSLRVGVAQGNIDQGAKWDESFQQSTLDIYARLSLKAKENGARLVVWPETAVPFYLGEQNPKQERVIEVVDNAALFVLTGAPSYNYNFETKGVKYFNSAYLFRPAQSGANSVDSTFGGGSVIGRYDKAHLVPYGEYVPLRRFFPFIKKLTAGVGDFSTGPGPVPISYKEASLGIIICYEAIFPKLSAGTVLAGADLLVNITNDAWFGKSSAPYQHFDMARFRAIENRVTLLRSANTGISAVIDPVGRVVAKSPLFEEALLLYDAPLREGGTTFYTRHPDLFAYLCLGFTILTLFYISIRRKKSGRI